MWNSRRLKSVKFRENPSTPDLGDRCLIEVRRVPSHQCQLRAGHYRSPTPEPNEKGSVSNISHFQNVWANNNRVKCDVFCHSHSKHPTDLTLTWYKRYFFSQHRKDIRRFNSFTSERPWEWKRRKGDVSFIFNLITHYISTVLNTLVKKQYTKMYLK